MVDSPSMLFQDPPEHTRLRTLVGKAFNGRGVERLRPHIQQIVDGLLDRLLDTRAMDVIADFAFPLPVRVISEMLGVPAGHQERFREWSLDIAASLDTLSLQTPSDVLARGYAAQEGIAEYFRDLIAERRRRPQDDLLTALIAAEENGEGLNDAELLATCGLLFVAGHETTVNLIGNGVLTLLSHPHELQKLREDPGLIGNTVEEVLRYESPIQRAGRMAEADVAIGGRTIGKGAIVSAVLSAANRDPAHFVEPDRFDITREDNRHLAFGWGTHFCLGAPLARAEGQIALGTLVGRLPKLALAGNQPEWRRSTEVRGLNALPVTF
jgi:pimeloyl-[acyl-carrier protein] synthase